jgi:hypothetical protein
MKKEKTENKSKRKKEKRGNPTWAAETIFGPQPFSLAGTRSPANALLHRLAGPTHQPLTLVVHCAARGALGTDLGTPPVIPPFVRLRQQGCARSAARLRQNSWVFLNRFCSSIRPGREFSPSFI